MRRPASTPSAPEPARIARIGSEGDGIGTLADGRTVFVPLSLPGELVSVRAGARRGDGFAATLAEVLTPAPDRMAPPCPHFGFCGGCALQHWADESYAAWKSSRLAEALTRAGYPDAAIAPLRRTAPRQRRRMDLAIRRAEGGVQVGLHLRGGSDVVDISACAVLHPTLLSLLAGLRRVLPGLAALRREGSAVVNLLDSGPDLLLRTDAALTTQDRTLLAAFAEAEGVPRIAWALGRGVPETACQLRPAVTRLGGVEITPPPGAFLQASAAGEAAITDAVLAGLPALSHRPVIELFAGCGTLSFPLAARARVHAFEGDAAALACLRRAAAGLKITAVQRDLVRQPLQPRELADAACVVLDPPFAGAAAQMPTLAAAGVERVIYVSCNPAALARDAAVLRAAGYALVSATPIDQFLCSARLESVVVFSLPRGTRR